MKPPKPQTSKIRIIGGKWRSRQISFLALPELRPTSDRIRETLFNWLAPYIQDANCLDLFAGSGALGFEALSRGAKSVVMIDHSQDIVNSLKKNAEILQAENLEIIQEKFPSEQLIFKKPFDIIFLDPPFQQNLITPAAQWLEQKKYLAVHALIYIEVESELNDLSLPENWKIIRDKKAGNVRYLLISRN